MASVLYNPLNGRLTARPNIPAATMVGEGRISYDVAKPRVGSNHWCSTENNRNNARNVNFNNGNANNNNKYNSNVVRPVVAFGDYGVPRDFIGSVYEAYHDCMRGKRRSTQALEYMQIAAEDLPILAFELWTGSYKPGISTCFLVKYPKLREVFAAAFRDRVVHHWICLRLNPLFEKRFVEQGNLSFNCRKGYGTDKAVEHVAEGMRRVSDNYHKPAWVFKGDLVGFFMSIDKNILWGRLERFIFRQYKGNYKDILLMATKEVVMHRPEQNCILNTRPEMWMGLAPNKSLFTMDTGMAIGNLTTQLFANFLMSYFVTYVRWIFRHKNYCFAQFVDDFALVCDDLPFLAKSIPMLEQFLKERLKLNLHKHKRYFQPVSHGILFVGTYIKPGRKYLSNRTVGRFTARCVGFGRRLNPKETEEGAKSDDVLDPGSEVSVFDLQHMEMVLNSYLGFCKGRRTYNIRKGCIEAMGEGFWRYFVVRRHYDSVRLKLKYRLPLN